MSVLKLSCFKVEGKLYQPTYSDDKKRCQCSLGKHNIPYLLCNDKTQKTSRETSLKTKKQTHYPFLFQWWRRFNFLRLVESKHRLGWAAQLWVSLQRNHMQFQNPIFPKTFSDSHNLFSYIPCTYIHSFYCVFAMYIYVFYSQLFFL